MVPFRGRKQFIILFIVNVQWGKSFVYAFQVKKKQFKDFNSVIVEYGIYFIWCYTVTSGKETCVEKLTLFWVIFLRVEQHMAPYDTCQMGVAALRDPFFTA